VRNEAVWLPWSPETQQPWFFIGTFRITALTCMTAMHARCASVGRLWIAPWRIC